ncbi:MAG TPA: hypothetical protein VFC16_15930 [Nakamurella sp.]|nr:hypothetical protein [Nakamurella sp.]
MLTPDEPALAPGPDEEDLGGDPVCWLADVCPECGRFVGRRPPAQCPRCGAAIVTSTH